jgi:Spy/CpxP family protein refolding chaperone
MKKIVYMMVAEMLVAGMALAQGDRPRPAFREGEGERAAGGGREVMLERVLQNSQMVKELGVTEDQVKVLQTAMFKAKEKEIKLRAEMELLGLKQARLMMEDDVDEDEVLDTVEQKWEIKAELAKITIRKMLLVKKTLTQEQRARMEEIMRERLRERGRDHRFSREGSSRTEGRFSGRRREGEGGPRPEQRDRE